MLALPEVPSILKHFGMTEPLMRLHVRQNSRPSPTTILSAMRDRRKYSWLAYDQRTK